jgi:hypothetical protein
MYPGQRIIETNYLFGDMSGEVAFKKCPFFKGGIFKL